MREVAHPAVRAAPYQVRAEFPSRRTGKTQRSASGLPELTARNKIHHLERRLRAQRLNGANMSSSETSPSRESAWHQLCAASGWSGRISGTFPDIGTQFEGDYV